MLIHQFKKPLRSLGIVLLLTACVLTALAWLKYVEKSEQLLTAAESIAIGSGVVQFVEHGVDNKHKGQTLVILHGTPGGFDQFNHYGHMLSARGYHVVLPSRAGYLGTDLNQRSLQQQSDTLANLLDILEIEKSVVIGISGGGPSALQFVADFPERTQAMILVAAVIDPLISPLDSDEPLPTLSSSQSLLFYLIHYFPGLVAPASPELSGVQSNNVKIAGQEMFQSLSFYGLRQEGYQNDWQQLLLQQSRPQGLAEQLKSLRVPTLAIHGQRDTNVPIEHSYALIDLVPNAQLIEVPSATHLFLVTEINLIVESVIEFVESL